MAVWYNKHLFASCHIWKQWKQIETKFKSVRLRDKTLASIVCLTHTGMTQHLTPARGLAPTGSKGEGRRSDGSGTFGPARLLAWGVLQGLSTSCPVALNAESKRGNYSAIWPQLFLVPSRLRVQTSKFWFHRICWELECFYSTVTCEATNCF